MKGDKDKLITFQDAVKTHELLDWIVREAGW